MLKHRRDLLISELDYEEKSLNTYYNWKSALKDCLDIEKLSKEISHIINPHFGNKMIKFVGLGNNIED